MGLSFKRGAMDIFLSTLVFFKGKNFSVIREFEMCGVHVKEYRYNMSRYLTDVWPPDLSRGSGFPIRSAIREDDGSDVTEMVLRFSGPRKNYVNPVSVARRKKRTLRMDARTFGRIRLVLEEQWEPYSGNVVITDALGFKKVIRIETNNGEARVSS
jgi:hypothetical protein